MNTSIEDIKGNFKNKHILSLNQFTLNDLKILFKTSDQMKKIVDKKGKTNILDGKIIAGLFYEPSSRTFTSFMTAAQRLGAGIIPLLGMQASSVAKGETIEDTIRTFGCNVDLIVMRHPEKGSLELAANASYVPVINAGDGIGEHPTQALLDMYTLREKFKNLDNLTGVLVGDLLNGRTVHALSRGLSLYKNVTLFLLSPKQLKLPKEYVEELSKKGLKLIEIENISQAPKDTNFWYWTRVQKERFSDLQEYELLKHKFVLSKELAGKYAGKNTIFMHPLPRVGEILTDVDNDPRSVYLTNQMRNGVYVRMALLSLVLGEK